MADKGRHHISWKTKCAAATRDLDYVRGELARFEGSTYRAIPYDDAKTMTEDQFLSLFQWDHNKLHSFGGGDHFSNLSPLPTKEHRAKTKRDAKIIAKSRRIRRKLAEHEPFLVKMADALSAGFQEGAQRAYDRIGTPLDLYSRNYQDINWNAKPKRRIRSRGFDKTKRRRMDGTVTRREK